MKNIKSFFGVALLATVLFSACEPNIPTKEGGVVINGVCWAKCNVGNFGTFVSNPTDYGMFYQWNRPTAYNTTTTGAISGWNSISPEGNVWEKANDPCPAGWRLPTVDEISTLLDTGKVRSDWVNQGGVFGRKFTTLLTNKSIFLPAAGGRSGNNGMLSAGEGGYWSSMEENSIRACGLGFDGDVVILSDIGKTYGYSVRCVAE